jgi:hypothetical protein
VARIAGHATTIEATPQRAPPGRDQVATLYYTGLTPLDSDRRWLERDCSKAAVTFTLQP